MKNIHSVLDSSVLVAALDESDPDHEVCRRLFLKNRGKTGAYSHALSETFSSLTGGRLGFRLSSSEAARLLRDHIVPRLQIIFLGQDDLLNAFDQAERRGIRGGAIYDFLHLAAARKVGARELHTLNVSDFKAFYRPGDPIIAPLQKEEKE